MSHPAEELEGLTLASGWVVDKRLIPRPTGTGGAFSTGYLVSHPDGRKGFLKAMDYSIALEAPNTIDVMKFYADAYVFERDICLKCAETKITRIVHAIDYGSYVGPLGPHTKVEYLIFERADGDIRLFLDQQANFDIAFAMRTLHSAAAALRQLHGAQMAHQDLKPSNVLVFDSEKMSKLGDMGRAWSKSIPAPHDGMNYAGDPGYAPLEMHYGVPLDEDAKRYGYDLYLLGNLIVFFFTRTHINGLLRTHIDPSFAASTAAMTYVDALPYLQAAFAESLKEIASHIPEGIRERLVPIVRELCEPDYTKRGNQLKSNMRRYSLERYVSAFDLLAKQAEIKLRPKSP